MKIKARSVAVIDRYTKTAITKTAQQINTAATTGLAVAVAVAL